MSTYYTGGCLCGKIHYRINGEPLRTMLCHCRTCRRQAGGPASAFAIFLRQGVEVIRGEPRSFQSSPHGTRHFCGNCGSLLFFQEQDSLEIDIFLGSLDEPEKLPPLAYQTWITRRLSWFPKMPELKSYSEERKA
ncbi:MAG: GFA family protein [Cyanophyceae cyanobacterium]